MNIFPSLISSNYKIVVKLKKSYLVFLIADTKWLCLMCAPNIKFLAF
jgi:hypothetical protein